MMVIDNLFELKQICFLKTDRDQLERMVTDININQLGVRYGLACGTGISWHYESEISVERDVLKSTAS